MTAFNQPLTLFGLLMLVAGQLLPQIDFSVVNVALKVMGQTLHTGETGLILIVAFYALCFSTLIATGARLGDRYGRKRLFFIGVIGFAIASVICGMSHSLYAMLIGRVLQGLFAALLMPQILSTIHATLNGERHSRAVSVYSAVAGISVAFGQILGGWLVSANLFDLGWRMAFFINVPLCVLILLVGYFVIPETKAEQKPNMDVAGIGLFSCLMLCLLIPIAVGQHWPHSFWLFVGIVPLGYWLKRVECRLERQGDTPLLPPALFRIVSAKIGLIAEVGVTFTYAGYLFVTAICLQKALHFSPFQSGNTFMGLGIMFFVGSLLSKRIVKKIGNYRCFLVGASITFFGFIITIAMFWLFRQNLLVAELMVCTGWVGFGNALMLTSAFRMTLSNVDKRYASEASSALVTVQQGLFALGTAFTGTIYSVTQPFGYLIAITCAITAISGVVVTTACIVWWYFVRRSVDTLCQSAAHSVEIHPS